MENKIPFMHYSVRITPFNGHHLNEIAFLCYVTLPDGTVLQSQCCENISIWKERPEMTDMLSSSITARLLDGLFKDIQDKIARIVFKEIKK